MTRLAHEFDATTSRIFFGMTVAWRQGREGDLNGAEIAFRELRAQHEAEGLIRYGMAAMYFDAERFDQAERHYRAAVESGIDNPTSFLPMAYLRIGNLLDLRGQRGGARSFYRKASGAARDHAWIRDQAKRYLKRPYTRAEP
jgi:Flp pilus assembly protein TadD